jgi:hypothetical protein
MGFGLQEDNRHGPDESIDLDNFNSGIKTIIRFHEHLGRAMGLVAIGFVIRGKNETNTASL